MELRAEDIISLEEVNEEFVYDLSVNDNHNYYIDCGYPILAHNSSKTVSILQLLYIIMQSWREPLEISVISYALPHLKGGAIRDWEKILLDENVNIAKIRNKTEHIYHIGKSEIEFFGVEGNEAKAHGPRRDILFVNEGNRRISWEVFDLMNSRTHRCTFVDFNPSAEFWWHEKIMPNFESTLIKSTYRDNPYLPEQERRNIEMKFGKPGFENWWRVYGEGELGKLEGAILPNWRFFQAGEVWPNEAASGYGLDFGYNDPDAMVKIAIDHKRKKIYLDEKIYQSGNSFDQLRTAMKFHCDRDSLIVADCADARMISVLRKEFNIRGVNKSRMTVSEALKMMQDYEIIITETSYNLMKELNNYLWNDKKAGIPIGIFDHLISAARYFFQENMAPKIPQRWSA